MKNQLLVIKPKKFERYLKELPKRGESFKRLVLRRSAQAFLDQVKKNAKIKGERYFKDLQIKMLNSSKIAFVVSVNENSVSLDKVGQSVILYKSISNKSNPVIEILTRYGPFVEQFLPLKSNPMKEKLIFRNISTKEYDEILNRNANSYDSLKRELIQAGVEKSRIFNFSKKDLFAVEDMVWNVLRKEFGLRQKKIPIWIPAISKYVSGDLLGDILSDEKLERILSDLHYRGYDDDGILKETVEEVELDNFNEFQSQIL